MWQNSQRPSIRERSIGNKNIQHHTNWVGVDTTSTSILCKGIPLVNHILEVCLARL